jgi:hypothetical protein
MLQLRIAIVLIHYNIAGSNFRSLSNIPYCWPKNQPGPYFSSSVVVHPLRPTKDRRLGKLLQ